VPVVSPTTTGRRALDRDLVFKQMVKALHAAGIEVILDVVYIAWFQPDAIAMCDEEWGTCFAKSFMLFLNGDLSARDSSAKLRRTTFVWLAHRSSRPPAAQASEGW
jgi:hypothetical protein